MRIPNDAWWALRKSAPQPLKSAGGFTPRSSMPQQEWEWPREGLIMSVGAAPASWVHGAAVAGS